MPTRLLLLLILVILFNSCEKSVYIPIPDASNKPVLNVLLNKDSMIMARVTLSSPIQNNLLMPEVWDAEVNLYENGTFKEKLTPITYSNRTFYRGNTLPKKGATYRVTAAVPGFTTIAGSDQIPDTVPIDEMKWSVAQINSWQTRTTVTVQLHDDPAVQNYYRVRLFVVNEWVDSNGNGGRQTSQLYFETEETNLNIFGDSYHPDFFTTDALFNGHSPRFIFRSNSNSTFKKIIVEVTSLTNNSYNYLNSASMAAEKNEDGFAEKVIVFNNIENGLGIVGGIAQREYELTR